jgi:hypothetical protein
MFLIVLSRISRQYNHFTRARLQTAGTGNPAAIFEVGQGYAAYQPESTGSGKIAADVKSDTKAAPSSG